VVVWGSASSLKNTLLGVDADAALPRKYVHRSMHLHGAVSVSTTHKVMDVHPSRSAAICLHRMTAIKNPFARGRSGRVGAFLD